MPITSVFRHLPRGSSRLRLLSTGVLKGVCLSLLLNHQGLQAKTLLLLDQFNQPISDAVVAVAAESADLAGQVNNIAVMDQINKQFVPQVLTIQRGQQVSFPNSDNIRHHVYSFSATKPFEIKLFKGEQTQPILFDQAGIAVLGCNIHDNMIGYIYVADKEITTLSNPQGEVSIADNVQHITVWHANMSAHNTERQQVELSQMTADEQGRLVLKIQLLPGQEDKPDVSSGKFKKKFG